MSHIGLPVVLIEMELLTTLEENVPIAFLKAKSVLLLLLKDKLDPQGTGKGGYTIQEIEDAFSTISYAEYDEILDLDDDEDYLQAVEDIGTVLTNAAKGNLCSGPHMCNYVPNGKKVIPTKCNKIAVARTIDGWKCTIHNKKRKLPPIHKLKL